MKNKLLKTLIICLSLSMLVACGTDIERTTDDARSDKIEKNLDDENENSTDEESELNDSEKDDSENQITDENDDDSKIKKKDSKEKRKVVRKLNRKTKNDEDIYRIRATLKEKNDNSFVIVDKNGTNYTISFEEKPEGYDRIEVEDKVQIDFTGELSKEGLNGSIVKIKAGRKK